MNNREELKKHLAGICPPLQNLGNRAYQDVLADFITEQTRLARIDELNYWTHRGSGQIEMSAEQVTNRITQLVPKPEKDNNR